ncbi:MAG TPA: signal peptidase II [Candidatus Nanoarchaeia archaeon]|nr:signal peptidase II [Candidatus Nanoarchaeia archaeon]
MLRYIFLIIVLFLFDLITKLFFKGKEIFLFKYFSFNYVENTGSIFGLFSRRNTFFTVLTLLILIVLVYIFREDKDSRLGISFIIAGAFGNFVDRINYGFVVDFIDLGFWPVFNLADCFIVAGVIFLAVKLYNK